MGSVDSEKSSQKIKSSNEEVPTKSYWYPDKTPNMNEVGVGYKAWTTKVVFVPLLLIPVFIGFFSTIISLNNEEIYRVYNSMQAEMGTKDFWMTLSMVVVGLGALFFVTTVYIMKKFRPVYLVDFVTYQGLDEEKIPHEDFMKHTINSGFFKEEDIEFQRKLLYRTGLGNETYFPPGICKSPPETNMTTARKEAMDVMSGCLDELFKRTGLKPTDIDILIVNCSLFNPTPSLTAMMINKYKMRSDIRNFNLAGMGCSAGIVSIDLAKDLLQVHKNSRCVIISTENITQNWYRGHSKSMLISNTLFRMGGAAIFLSNKWSDQFRAKYKLNCTVRVIKAANDIAYRAVYQEEDEQGNRGVALSKDLLAVAGDALKSNLTTLGPLVLPWSEQIKFFMNLCKRKIEIALGKEKKLRTPAYIPDFKKAFEHICIHAGGRAIIDGLEENLKLLPHHVEPSRATLYRYGNTSSSSIWYELQFIERSGRMHKGEKVWQIALGSGFKCNSAVWVRLK